MGSTLDRPPRFILNILGTSALFVYAFYYNYGDFYHLAIRVSRKHDFFHFPQHHAALEEPSGFYVKHIGVNWSYYGYDIPIDPFENVSKHEASISSFINIATQEQKIYGRLEQEKSRVWTFSPYNLEVWNQSEFRVMIVGPEPPTKISEINRLDAGEWFRTAATKNKFHGYRTFFNRCKILIDGILSCSKKENFNQFRYLSLKATAGSVPANEEGIEYYVKKNLDEVLEPLVSNAPRTGLSPHIVVVLGSNSQRTFEKRIKPALVKRNSRIKCIYMTHLLRGGMINRHVENMATEIYEKMLPLSMKTNRWHCWGRARGGEWLTPLQEVEVEEKKRNKLRLGIYE